MKVFYIDIDGTICSQEKDYKDAKPYPDRIARFNNLYNSGHRVIYWTARGTLTGIDWREVTVAQFREWGVLYHELKFGKPNYDYLIDDKAINAGSLRRKQ